MIRAHCQILNAADPRWPEVLEHVHHDVYHTPAYHGLSGFGHQGAPHLFVYREAPDRLFLWPYLLRPIPDTPSYDITSVYGYSGPLCSSLDPVFAARAWRELTAHWAMQGAVSAFTRFHPLLDNACWLTGVDGAIRGMRPLGHTVSIDLSIPAGQQVRGYQKVLRQEIRKAREAGFTVREDVEWAHSGTFVRLYRETMMRRGSHADYLIDAEWLEECRRALGAHGRLFIAELDGQIGAALLAIEHHPFLHAHLTGVDPALSAHSPLKVLLDGIREWGAERGLSSFHLGGGLGGREDSLFHFKRRFSPLTHPFHIGRWVLDSPRYRELESMHHERVARRGHQVTSPDFFPAYRCPSMPPPFETGHLATGAQSGSLSTPSVRN